MSPAARPVAKRTGAAGRQVQPRVLSRFAPSSVNLEDQVLQFREARKLREQARLEKLRDCRLRGTAAVGFNASTSIKTPAILLKNAVAQLPAGAKASSSKTSSVKLQLKPKVSTGSRCNQQPGAKTSQSLVNINRLPTGVKHLPLRRSQGGRKSILKTRVRKIPKAEVKLTKTTQLRMLKSDPLLELSSFSTSYSKKMILPLPVSAPPPKQCFSMGTEYIDDGGLQIKSSVRKENEPQQVSGVKPKSAMKIVSAESLNKLQSPSRIPVRKTSFVSPLKKVPVTPKPSPLRERLAEWLEKRNHSLDNFKHLKCFGVLGPAVKRPQTPFRKTILSTTSLKSIPESTESTPNKESFENSSDEDVGELNTTFTLEEEDKENISHIRQQAPRAIAHNVTETQDIRYKELDQAHGVLSELHNLIKMGYPIEQCGLWLRAVRRRFPQCGDEAIYWECLASIEEARGDLQTAVSCYERALSQGGESSVQTSLDELLKKMCALKIEPVLDVSRLNVSKQLENQLLDSSNIINSSSIQFAVKETPGSSKKCESLNDTTDSVFTATPVRRSMRLAGTPKRGTPGVTCVRSLEFLEPDVRSSVVFHNNSALDLED